jgi:hypothetical protein
MPCPSIGPKLFWTVQNVLDGYTSFLLGPNCFDLGPINFDLAQVRLFWTHIYDLDLTKMNWTYPKLLLIKYSNKIIWMSKTILDP